MSKIVKKKPRCLQRQNIRHCGSMMLKKRFADGQNEKWSSYNLDKLRNDYEHMQNMLFGEKPSFEEIMDGIAKLETKINLSRE